jgi:hypothetical protein
MSRYLIYTIAFGERYAAFAAMLVESIYSVGNWAHDVIIMHDGSFIRHKKADCMNVRQGNSPVSSREECWRYKTLIGGYADLSCYDYIFYLDADILVNTSRLPSMIASLASSDRIYVMKDRKTIGMNRRSTGRYLLTNLEKLKWASVAINAGIVGFPANSFGFDFLERWKEMNLSQPENKFDDQASLYAVLLRNYESRWQYIGDTTHGRELKRYAETFIHFTMFKDRFMARYFRDVLELDLSYLPWASDQ